VLLFVGAVAGVAVYFAQRPTIARGDVLAAQLIEANPKLVKAVTCDRAIPIGVAGARFSCAIVYRNGERARERFRMDRDGAIHPAE
jgi:hypothetical protein